MYKVRLLVIKLNYKISVLGKKYCLYTTSAKKYGYGYGYFDYEQIEK